MKISNLFTSTISKIAAGAILSFATLFVLANTTHWEILSPLKITKKEISNSNASVHALTVANTTYRTAQPGNWTDGSTWIGGVAPPEEIIEGDSVIINHKVILNIDAQLLQIGDDNTVGVLVINDTLENINIPGHSQIGRGLSLRKNGRLIMCDFALILHVFQTNGDNLNSNFEAEGGVIHAKNGLIEVGMNWSSGEKDGVHTTRVMENTCMRIGENYLNEPAIDTLTNVCVEIGLHGSGNAQFQNNGCMHIIGSAVQFILRNPDGDPAGNFQISSGGSKITGDTIALICADQINNSSTLNTAVVAGYCAPGGTSGTGDFELIAKDCDACATATCDNCEPVGPQNPCVNDTTFLPQGTTCDAASAGMDTVFLTNQAGCDSLVITDTILAASDTTRLPQGTTCDAASAGMDTVFLTNQAGCDSLVITDTVLAASDTTRLPQGESCDLASVGMDTLFLTNQAGCDSLVITDTILAASDTTRLPQGTTCDAASAGMDTLFLTNQAGCDSLVITDTILLVGDIEITCPPDQEYCPSVGAVPPPFADLEEFLNNGGMVSSSIGIDTPSFMVDQVNNNDTIERTYSIGDTCGNRDSCLQRFIPTFDDPVLTCPDTLRVCDTMLVPPPFTTFDEFLAGGGSVDDPAKIDPATFMLLSDMAITPTQIERRYKVTSECSFSDVPCTHVILIEGPCAVIPTMSQWATFLFALIIFTLFVAGLYNLQLMYKEEGK